MQISSSDSSSSEISQFFYTATLACLPTVVYIVAERALRSLLDGETAAKYAFYPTLIPMSFLIMYNASVFGGSIVIFLAYQLYNIPIPPRNSFGLPIWNPQMSCIIADEFIGMIENNNFIPTREFYQQPLLDDPPCINILDRFAHRTPYKPDVYDRFIKEIIQPKLKSEDVACSFKSILQRLDAPLLAGIAPILLASDVNVPTELANIKAAIETLEPYRRSLFRKVVSHLHFVSQKPTQYHMTSDQLAQVFEPLLFGPLSQQAGVAILKHFIENPALYSLDKIST